MSEVGYEPGLIWWRSVTLTIRLPVKNLPVVTLEPGPIWWQTVTLAISTWIQILFNFIKTDWVMVFYRLHLHYRYCTTIISLTQSLVCEPAFQKAYWLSDALITRPRRLLERTELNLWIRNLAPLFINAS